MRSQLADAKSGNALVSAVHEYRRWKKGLYCNPAENAFRPHPLGSIEGLEAKIVGGLVSSNITQRERGIAVATTGSTPVAVDEDIFNALFVL